MTASGSRLSRHDQDDDQATMPGFGDNLRRIRSAAGLSPADLAGRVGETPLWLTHLEVIGVALPELPQLTRLAEALGCQVDDLLQGPDEAYDHPRRRHAALIAARLGRAGVLLGQVSASRARGEITPIDERRIDEPALLASVGKCRGWVTSPDADLGLAADLERELDGHLKRIRLALDGVAERVARGVIVLPEPRRAPTAPAATGPTPSSSPVTPAPVPATRKGPPRLAGHRTVLWSRPVEGGDDYECEMFTRSRDVDLRVVCGDRVLASWPCKNLDEAFTLSHAWRRVPDLEAHFAEPATA
jgi:transcriptional regulator with XRE-family HTH domain